MHADVSPDETNLPRIGALLLEEGVITQQELDEALGMQSLHLHPLGQTLEDMGLISHRQLKAALRKQSNLKLMATMSAVLWSPFQQEQEQEQEQEQNNTTESVPEPVQEHLPPALDLSQVPILTEQQPNCPAEGVLPGPLLVGIRESVALPQLNLIIEAELDQSTAHSSLFVEDLILLPAGSAKHIAYFKVRDPQAGIVAAHAAPVQSFRTVQTAIGLMDMLPVITLPVQLGEQTLEGSLTLIPEIDPADQTIMRLGHDTLQQQVKVFKQITHILDQNSNSQIA